MSKGSNKGATGRLGECREYHFKTYPAGCFPLPPFPTQSTEQVHTGVESSHLRSVFRPADKQKCATCELQGLVLDQLAAESTEAPLKESVWHTFSAFLGTTILGLSRHTTSTGNPKWEKAKWDLHRTKCPVADETVRPGEGKTALSVISLAGPPEQKGKKEAPLNFAGAI